MRYTYNNLEVQYKKLFRHLKVGSFKTRERYGKAFKRFMRFLAREYNLQKLANIAPKHIFAYVEYMQNKGLSASTIKTELATKTGLSADYTVKHFKAELSISPTEYLRRYRVAKSMELLRSTDLPVNDIAVQSGFGDMSAFSRVFKMYEGETPSAYRKRYRIFGE